MSFALITGASKGIGKAIANELARRGNDLLLIARSEDLLKKLSREIRKSYKVAVHYLAIDLAKQEAPENIFCWLSRIFMSQRQKHMLALFRLSLSMNSVIF